MVFDLGTWGGRPSPDPSPINLPPAKQPDIPARAFEDPTGVVRMIVGSTAYSHMSGPSLTNQTRDCAVTYNKTADGNPADFAADEYLDSPIAFDNGTAWY